MRKNPKFVELFAGCGGMSLGLKSAGFDFFMGNELSPMAAETYAYNLLGADLRKGESEKILWLKSYYPKGDIKRLTERPNDFSKGENKDVDNKTDLNGRFLVGDIYTLLNVLEENKKLKNQLRKAKIDLVSGGPPCQSFSLAGRREKDNKRNNLPWAFAEFIDIVKPKLVLLENVSGILRAFNTREGKYYAWFEVAKAFALKGYVPICMHLNAKYFELPQNRPRFIMLGIKRGILNKRKTKNDQILINAIRFFEETKESEGRINYETANYFRPYDLMSNDDVAHFFNSDFLPTPPIVQKEKFKSVDYAIGAIKELEEKFSIKKVRNDNYKKELDKHFPISLKPAVNGGQSENEFYVENHNLRKHSKKIQDRFRFYKTIQALNNGEKNKLFEAIRKGIPASISEENLEVITTRLTEINNQSDLNVFIETHASKKHSQRPLQKDLPAPAALSIPDDYCHYDQNQQRTLSVREMARIQSFPDWFVFRAKDTTGGKNRRHEVPNYTQVGNAVPPLLAKHLGEWIIGLLKELDNGL